MRATRWLEHENAVARFDLTIRAFRRALLEQRYRPDQPRVPAGRPEGGEWTRVGTGRGDSVGVAEVIYVCTRVGSVPIKDETGGLAYAVSYLCGFGNQLLSWITTRKLKPIIRDPRF
ncbi:MAG: hypothetical protein HY834_19395 [Devosia nanyangense]|uniref:Uncharacterized protein n=1 Tax=Devosia nanyangense TaxID=1228055 RepID=A0A933L443_9HYPH|nr:hypothetical protein [Devosia nanyangense]